MLPVLLISLSRRIRPIPFWFHKIFTLHLILFPLLLQLGFSSLSILLAFFVSNENDQKHKIASRSWKNTFNIIKNLLFVPHLTSHVHLRSSLRIFNYSLLLSLVWFTYHRICLRLHIFNSQRSFRFYRCIVSHFCRKKSILFMSKFILNSDCM